MNLYYEKDSVLIYNHDGTMEKEIILDFNLSDLNDIVTCKNETYIKLIDEDDAITDGVLIINHNNGSVKVCKVENKDYYSLKLVNNKVYLINETSHIEVKELIQKEEI